MAFLGILDEKIKIINDHEQCSYKDNKIGGQPLFSPMFDVVKFFKNNQINCSHCSKLMAFILQMYCPIDNSDDDRILYIFSCVNKDCTEKKCRIFRIITKATQTKKTESKLFEDNWDDDECNSNIDLIESSKIINNTNTDIIENNKDDCCEKYSYFFPYYIGVIEESNDESIDDRYKKIAKKIKNNDNENFVNEEYEKSYPDVFKNDKENYKFYKQLRKCPEQLIRYQWSGEPLKPSSSEKTNFIIKNCNNCGSLRIFEFQLMPSLINILCKNKKFINNNNDMISLIDFETILIFTCRKNCNLINNNNIQEEQLFLFKENYSDIKI